MTDFVDGLMAFVFFACIVAMIVQLVRRKWKSVGILLGVAFVSIIIGAVVSPTSSKPTSTKVAKENAATSAPAAAEPTNTPEPTPESRQALKHDFVQSIDESISGARIAAAPFKYVGKRVDLHCTVASIPQEDFFNASCGEDADGMPVNVVVQFNSRDLSQGQAVRVLGTVVEPIEGTNAMGGETHFPTVKAEFME